MRAKIIRHEKIIDELGNTVEIKMWQLSQPSMEKPHGYKYSLVYIVEDTRVIGYDNAEGKGDHRHIRGKTEPYKFVSLRKLANDFYRDIERYKRGEI
ncbi:MAG: hypothetical protein A2Y97_04935 [Nitrospirae bacterium RBG_13_39_12]|nr:MAG: hypothetical protein A2Y97_04935 [Nitrospirae bacterium RBG_13_39_12]